MHDQTHYDNSYVSHYKMAIFSCMSNTTKYADRNKGLSIKNCEKKEQIMTTTLSWNETLSPIAIK